MNRTEAEKIVKLLEANYQPFKDLAIARELWSAAFIEDDYKEVYTAVMAIIQTDNTGFRPTIGKIRKVMHDLKHGSGNTELEAWNIVRRAVENSGYHSAEEYRKLPPEIQRLTSPSQLYQWAVMDAEEFETVVQSNFMRSYRVIAEEAERREMLPSGFMQSLEEPKTETESVPRLIAAPNERYQTKPRELSETAKAMLERLKG